MTDPRDGRVRYVGLTHDPAGRLTGHHTGLDRRQPNGDLARVTRKDDWLRALQAEGLRAQMVVLEEVDASADPVVREALWIDRLRTGGADLLNGRVNVGTERGPERLSPEEVAAFRAARGWSQRELGLHLGLDGSAVSLWETGRRGVPRLVRLALERLEQMHPAAS